MFLIFFFNPENREHVSGLCQHILPKLGFDVKYSSPHIAMWFCLAKYFSERWGEISRTGIGFGKSSRGWCALLWLSWQALPEVVTKKSIYNQQLCPDVLPICAHKTWCLVTYFKHGLLLSSQYQNSHFFHPRISNSLRALIMPYKILSQ